MTSAAAIPVPIPMPPSRLVPGGVPDDVVSFVLPLEEKGQAFIVPMLGYDAASVHVRLENETTFNSGVVTVTKSNFQDTRGSQAIGGGVTISSAGLTEILPEQFNKAAYLIFQVSTAASASTRLALAVCRRRFLHLG